MRMIVKHDLEGMWKEAVVACIILAFVSKD